MKKIYWAFDAFEDGLKTNIFVAETLASLNEHMNAEIHPVFMLGAETVAPAASFFVDMLETVKKTADEKILSVLNKVHVPGVMRSEILVENNYSKTSIVKKFVNEAEKNGATLIAVGHHGRVGLERGILGSFAETLLLHSHLPVLVVGQNFDQIPRWDSILFPTDFSDDSSYAFHKVLELSKKIGAKVTLFHHLSPKVDPVVQSIMAPFGGVWIPYRQEMENAIHRNQKMADEWTTMAKSQGVELKTIINTESTNTAQAILTYAEANKIGFIAMGAQSGTIATTLFGSTTRRVVREAMSPVWIIRRH